MFFQAQETVLSAIGGCSVEQGRVLRRVRCGSVPLYTTKPAQAQGSRLPAMRHRSLNNFYKKWDNNIFLYPSAYSMSQNIGKKCHQYRFYDAFMVFIPEYVIFF